MAGSPPPWVKKAMGKKAAGKAPFRRGAGCSHCYIWARAESDGVVLIKCAHCPQVSKKLVMALVDQDFIQRGCDSTRAAHARICRRSAR